MAKSILDFIKQGDLFNFAHPKVEAFCKLPTRGYYRVLVPNHLDLYAYTIYNDFNLAIPLAIYNGIVNPYDIPTNTVLRLFSVDEYKELLNDWSRESVAS